MLHYLNFCHFTKCNLVNTKKKKLSEQTTLHFIINYPCFKSEKVHPPSSTGEFSFTVPSELARTLWSSHILNGTRIG